MQRRHSPSWTKPSIKRPDLPTSSKTIIRYNNILPQLLYLSFSYRAKPLIPKKISSRQKCLHKYTETNVEEKLYLIKQLMLSQVCSFHRGSIIGPDSLKKFRECDQLLLPFWAQIVLSNLEDALSQYQVLSERQHMQVGINSYIDCIRVDIADKTHFVHMKHLYQKFHRE